MHQIACHDCDLVHNIPRMPAGTSARCVRCGALLFSVKINSIDRTLAWTISGLVLYIVAITFPFLAMQSGSVVQQTALISGVQQLFRQQEIALAAMVLLTCILVPLLQMLILLYIFIPLKLNMQLPFAIPIFRLFRHFKPWSMMEIYLIGIMVAMVKLGKMATIVPGIAVAAFALLVIVLACAVSAIDSHLVWKRLGGES